MKTIKLTPRIFTTIRAAFAVILACATLSFSVSQSHGMELDDLHIMTEHYPPYSYFEGGQFKGLSTEILLAILEKSKSNLTQADFELVPWTRAYTDAQTKAGSLLYSMTRLRERAPLFKWVGPIVKSRVILIKRTNSPIIINSVEELAQHHIGAVRNGMSDILLQRLGVPQKNLIYSSMTWGTVSNLLAGKTDLVAIDELVAKHIVKELGGNPKDIEEVLLLDEGTLYFALHRRTPDKIISTLQRALEQIKTQNQQGSSEYRKILKRYGAENQMN